MHFGLNTIEEKLNKESLEAVTKKNQNQLRNLNISSKWRKTDAIPPSTTQLNPSQLISSTNNSEKIGSGLNITKRNLTKPGFLPSLNELHSALKEDTKSFSSGIFTKPQLSARSVCKIRKREIDAESDDDENENNYANADLLEKPSARSSCSYHLNNDPPLSKTSSMQSLHETLLEKNIYNSAPYPNEFASQLAEYENDSFLIGRNKTITLPFDLAAAAARDDDDTLSICTNVVEDNTKLNFITVLGLFVCLLVSKSLQYLQMYLSWFLSQVDQVRKMFLGSTTFLDFLNLEDTRRYKVRTKLMLLPLIGACSLLYGVVFLMHFSVHFLLMTAPSALTAFVRRLQRL